MVKILLTILGIATCGFLYRCGGMSKEDAKKIHIPLFLARSWVRDWLCPIFSLGLVLLWKQNWSWIYYPVAYGLTGGALSTYWDKIFKEDNFYAHGFMCGLASFTLFWTGIHWWAILIGAVACGWLMGWLCKKYTSVWVEEIGRGTILAVTRLILLI